MSGKHMVKSWSSTQANVALSSGEAEYRGLVKGVSVALGRRGVRQEIAIDVNVRVNTGANAAKGLASRGGLGKVRHVEAQQLWATSGTGYGGQRRHCHEKGRW